MADDSFPPGVFDFSDLIRPERGLLEVQGAHGNVHKHKLEIQFVAIKSLKTSAQSTDHLREYRRVSIYKVPFFLL
jgi:hypothetical protein